MKLQLVNSTETFDAPRGIGLALIAAKVATEYKEPVKPAAQEVLWGIIVSGNEQIPAIKAECPVCHQGQVSESLAPFRHCRRVDNVPENFVQSYKKLRKEVKPWTRPVPPTNQGRVGWLG